jgi:hypothetical protein
MIRKVDTTNGVHQNEDHVVTYFEKAAGDGFGEQDVDSAPPNEAGKNPASQRSQATPIQPRITSITPLTQWPRSCQTQTRQGGEIRLDGPKAEKDVDSPVESSQTWPRDDQLMINITQKILRSLDSRKLSTMRAQNCVIRLRLRRKF